jgi:chromosomal replication initiator protein
VFKQNIRKQLLETFPADEIRRWFDPLDISVDPEGCLMRVVFPHLFFRERFMSEVRPVFENIASKICENLEIVYSLGCGPAGKYSPPSRPGKSVFHKRAYPEERNNLLLEQFTFENFLFNRKNDFPLAVVNETVEKVSACEPPPFTPFVLHGQSGSGKSHLLGAMANALKKNGLHVFYGNTAAFMESITLGSGRYADPEEDCIFLDDAQGCANEANTQAVLAALIDICLASGRLLVLSFDTHPALCRDLSQKLASRLASGLCVELKRPDMNIRLVYAEKQNKLLDLGLKSELILNLVRRTQDIRGIDGYMARLTAFRSMVSKQGANAVSYDASAIIDKNAEGSKPTPASIIAQVARHFSVNPEDVISRRRDKATSLPRHIAIFLCRDLLGLSLVQIGGFFGKRDHTSILYSLKKMGRLLDSDKDMHSLTEDLGKLCLGRH